MPWFPLFAADFLTDPKAIAMTPEARGVFIWLLCYQHIEESLPEDEETLQLLGGCTGEVWARVRESVLPMFPVDPKSGRRTNGKMKRHSQASKQSHDRRSRAGLKGAIARWGKVSEKPNQRASGVSSEGASGGKADPAGKAGKNPAISMPSQCHPNAIPMPSQSESDGAIQNSLSDNAKNGQTIGFALPTQSQNMAIRDNRKEKRTFMNGCMSDEEGEESSEGDDVEHQIQWRNSNREIDKLVDYQTEVLNKLDGITDGRERKDRGSLLLIARHVPPNIVHSALETTQDARLRGIGNGTRLNHPAYFISVARAKCEEAGYVFPLKRNGSI